MDFKICSVHQILWGWSSQGIIDVAPTAESQSVYENLWKNLRKELTDATHQPKITSDMCSVHGFCDDSNEHWILGFWTDNVWTVMKSLFTTVSSWCLVHDSAST